VVVCSVINEFGSNWSFEVISQCLPEGQEYLGQPESNEVVFCLFPWASVASHGCTSA
jgi:hypothetical protein